MNWKTIFNPFGRFDEKYLLGLGIISLLAIILINQWTGSYFTSIYRIDRMENFNLQKATISTIISYVSMIAVLFVLGKILYKKTRIIDIINTVLISQIPLIMILPFEKIEYTKDVTKRVIAYQDHPSGAFPILDFIFMFLTIAIAVGALVYSIVLFYNGFKTATNIKKWQHVTLFCIVTFLTVILCQIFNK